VRDELREQVRQFTGPPTTAEELSRQVEVGRKLQAHEKQVKATRLELAAPLNAACDRLIEIANGYLAPLIADKELLSRYATVYRMAEEERIRREEAERAAEVARLEAVRMEAEAKAARARSEAGQLRAELVAHEASTAQMEVIRAPLPQMTKARGSATRRDLKYVVTDIRALYAARPELCHIEERPSAIKALCNPPAGANAVTPDKSIPGLSVYWEINTSFRA
jgi:hypothetical protein